MHSTQAAVILLLTLIAWTCGVCIAEEFTVGDRAGWHPGNNVDYQKWSARHSYRVGDSLLFAYDRSSQSVMRVGSEDYHACRTHRPIEHHTTGSTLINLKREDYFFISGVADHCNAGMKLAVILAGGSPSTAPAPAAATTPPPPPPPPTTPPLVAPTLPPTPLASPTPAPLATPPGPLAPVEAPASAPIASAPPSPTEAPAPTTGLSPPAPFAFPPVSPPTAPKNAAPALHSTIAAIITLAAASCFTLLL